MATNLEQVRFIARDGQILDLTQYGTYNLLGRRNFDAPDVQVYSERLPNWPGSRLTGVSVRERQIQFSVEVMAGSWIDSREKIGNAIDVLAQDGAINVIANGRERQLDVAYVGGLGNDTGSRSGTVLTLVPEYRAMWPYWYDVTAQVQPVDLQFAVAGAPMPMSFPVFFGATGLAMSFTLEGGDVASPWSCAIQGPLTRVELARLDTREVLDIAATVNAGERLLLSTYTGQRRVKIDTASGVKDVLSGPLDRSIYWQIGPGLTSCAIRITGTTNRVATFNWYKYYRSSN
jgi:hypothetical protein